MLKAVELLRLKLVTRLKFFTALIINKQYTLQKQRDSQPFHSKEFMRRMLC